MSVSTTCLLCDKDVDIKTAQSLTLIKCKDTVYFHIECLEAKHKCGGKKPVPTSLATFAIAQGDGTGEPTTWTRLAKNLKGKT